MTWWPKPLMGASPYEASWRNRQRSVILRPAPPYSSGIAMPSQPRCAIFSYSFWLCSLLTVCGQLVALFLVPHSRRQKSAIALTRSRRSSDRTRGMELSPWRGR